MENQYYTILDIQIITGCNKYEASRIIKELNGELKIKFKDTSIKDLICKGRVLKDYFINRNWRNEI